MGCPKVSFFITQKVGKLREPNLCMYITYITTVFKSFMFFLPTKNVFVALYKR